MSSELKIYLIQIADQYSGGTRDSAYVVARTYQDAVRAYVKGGHSEDDIISVKRFNGENHPVIVAEEPTPAQPEAPKSVPEKPEAKPKRRRRVPDPNTPA